MSPFPLGPVIGPPVVAGRSARRSATHSRLDRTQQPFAPEPTVSRAGGMPFGGPWRLTLQTAASSPNKTANRLIS